jgi:aminotransferase
MESSTGINPKNVCAAVGGRDGLQKAYQAMLALGFGRQGDLILVSRVPWISYSWGPYAVGANVLYAPGSSEDSWAYSIDGIFESIRYADKYDRKIAGLIITSPDNPTGRTLSIDDQVHLAKGALQAGIAYVFFDWMYHYITDGTPYDLNNLLSHFSEDERSRLLFMDGITKSLGGSNIRNCHIIASEEVIQYITARSSHEVIPSYYSQAVAIAAYAMGYHLASSPIVIPTNTSRELLRNYLNAHQYKYILGQGYYAFIDVSTKLNSTGVTCEELGQRLAENYGIAVVPGSFFSEFGNQWIRFSYATPPERTIGAIERLNSALNDL